MERTQVSRVLAAETQGPQERPGMLYNSHAWKMDTGAFHTVQPSLVGELRPIETVPQK